MSRFAFVGSANALGMMYAMELRHAGHEVEYFVTSPPGDTLNRPENHYAEIGYPYDGWVTERIVEHPLRANLFATRYLGDLIGRLESFDHVVLSGVYLMLASHLRSAKPIFLSHGSDLDVWCNRKQYRHHLRKALRGEDPPGALASAIGVARMRRAFSRCAIAITFPAGLSAERDAVFEDVSKGWTGETIYRFDVSFRPVAGVGRIPPLRRDRLVLLCAVRCSFLPEAGASPSDMKGVDSIIRGVGQYVALGRMPVELHLIEKGKDLVRAKQLCAEAGIESHVIWHKEMPFRDLLSLYEQADICFDQVSSSWLGAVGCYSLYLGRPLIANSRREVLQKLWPLPSPVCEAATPSQVCQRLVELEDVDVRAEVSLRSREFAQPCLGPSRVTRALLERVKSDA